MTNQINFKVGDLIFAYDKGFHRCVKITPRDSTSGPIVTYHRVYTLDGKRLKGGEQDCAAGFCRLVEASHIQKLIAARQTEIVNLTNILIDHTPPEVYLDEEEE
jgi:hypothetical protein